jgi:hypothetical protein
MVTQGMISPERLDYFADGKYIYLFSSHLFQRKNSIRYFENLKEVILILSSFL